jgi:glycerol-1-phosphate dehydrogenase [NAD(P)+]
LAQELDAVTQDILAEIVAGRYPDPDGGAPLQVATKSVRVAKSLAGIEGELVMPLGLGSRLAVVSDRTTHGVLGARVERALAAKGEVVSVILPHRPHADSETVAMIREATASADALVAVGSGTINDLCKYASAQDRKPYVVFGTAPSMNGYTSVNAAITVHGHKKSLTAQAPLGAFMDLSIMAAAPVRMIRSGLGDSLCRPTAQADWLLAHLLFDQPYRNMPFHLLAPDEMPMLDETDALVAGDIEAMERLVRTLLLSGFGTAIHGTSQPASQGEHLISHYADMLGDAAWPFSFHGEQIGVTTLSMARLQQAILEGPAPELAPDRNSEANFMARFGEALGKSCWAEFAQKRLDGARAAALNQRIAERWQRIRATIAGVIYPVELLERALKRAGAPMRPQDLGWPEPFYRTALRHAREIRNRYTFLDLAADSGRLDGLADRI